MPKSRSSLLIAIGAAVFVVGSALTFLVANRSHHSATPEVRTAATTPAASSGDVTAAGSTAPTSFTIPAGKQAVAIAVPYVQAVAGFVKAGDKVNVFGTIKPSSPAPKGLAPPPAAKLILSDVQVLSTTPAAAAGGGNTVFVLALSPADAEQVVYFQSWEGLYLTLARSDQGILSTPGRSAGAPF